MLRCMQPVAGCGRPCRRAGGGPAWTLPCPHWDKQHQRWCVASVGGGVLGYTGGRRRSRQHPKTLGSHLLHWRGAPSAGLAAAAGGAQQAAAVSRSTAATRCCLRM